MWMVLTVYRKYFCGWSHLDSLKMTFTVLNSDYAQVLSTIQWITPLGFYSIKAQSNEIKNILILVLKIHPRGWDQF